MNEPPLFLPSESRGIYSSESVNSFPTYFTTLLISSPYYAHISIVPLWISSPISILAELWTLPKKQGICKNIYPWVKDVIKYYKYNGPFSK